MSDTRIRPRGRVTRVAAYHGEEIGPGIYAPSPLDEVDAELQDGTVISCYRCEIDETPPPQRHVYKCKRHGEFTVTMTPSEWRSATGRSMPCPRNCDAPVFYKRKE